MSAKVSEAPPPFVFSAQSLPEQTAEEYWKSLQAAISKIQAGKAKNLKYEELYRKGYMLTLHKYDGMLYKGVETCVKKQLTETAVTVGEAKDGELLERLVHAWRHHKRCMAMIRDILMYMDKKCKDKRLMPVYEMGISHFRDIIIKHEGVEKRLSQVLLKHVENERKGMTSPRVLMRHAVSMLYEVSNLEDASQRRTQASASVDLHAQLFETPFLEQTKSYYAAEMTAFIASHDMPTFLLHVENRLVQEEGRAESYLSKPTKPKLRSLLQKEIILKYSSAVIEDVNSGVVAMLKADKTKDLERCYALFSREPRAMESLRQALRSVVTTMGTDIVQHPDVKHNPTEFVQSVLDIREKYSNIVQKAFKDDRTFVRALKESIEAFINLDVRSAQYLTLYIDEMFRKKLKGLSSQEIENRLSNVISIFRYLQEKDIFEDFYKKQLASRLLLQQSIDREAEQKMITELKAECGHQYTARLEGMFRDMKQSKEIMIKYRRSKQLHGSLRDVNFLSVTVLTTGFWPLPLVQECKLPQEAAVVSRDFRKFYIGLHKGRRLTWQPNMGTAELRVRFRKGNKELLVHTYQMCILMLFNQHDTLTYQQILDWTNIPEDQMSRHLLSLAHPKVRILRKDPNNRTIGPDHKFSFNENYSSKLIRVRVPLLTASRTLSVGEGQDGPVDSNDHIPENVLELRKHRVEAAIVRIMKARKELEHNNLVAEVAKQLESRFPADPAFIKKRIESLIEREYLKRDETNRKVYHYV